jgi:hypothetical protein
LWNKERRLGETQYPNHLPANIVEFADSVTTPVNSKGEHKMAKGDVAATFTLPKEVDDLITTMAQRRKTTRRAVIVQAVRAMAASKSEKALWTPTP